MEIFRRWKFRHFAKFSSLSTDENVYFIIPVSHLEHDIFAFGEKCVSHIVERLSHF